MSPKKFRAWDTNKLEMIEPGNPYVSQFLACDIANMISVFDPDKFPSMHEEHPYIFEQFTGLHDKNGVEIYEGDIVEYSKADGILRKGKVVFYNGSFSVSTHDMPYITLGSFLSVGIKVLGNIHKNQELLSPKQ